MKKYLNLLSNTEFFHSIPEDKIADILNLYLCFFKHYHAGEIIYPAGSEIRYSGIILEGSIDVVHPSSTGNDTIVNRLLPGCMFGESFACLNSINVTSDIRSVTDSFILFLDIRRLLNCTECNLEYRIIMAENIMKSLAQSNILLNTKIQLLTQKTLREKLLLYFHILATQNHSNEFNIPFNREQLACFLASERSSVCRELSRLKNEGVISLSRNHVKLL